MLTALAQCQRCVKNFQFFPSCCKKSYFVFAKFIGKNVLSILSQLLLYVVYSRYYLNFAFLN
ncbi:MAG: hypothetical protein RMI04_09190 [Thermofilaceae archaeon]|nr:hypothetical protein [Thermofilaceae archaeon]